MRKKAYIFLLRGVLVMLPMGLFLAVAEFFLWKAGETVSVRKIARTYDRSGPPACYLPALIGQQFNLFHYERVLKMRPRLLVLGSSRVTRFREEMFGVDAGFYNSGRTMSCVEDVEQYFEALPEDYVPEVLLLGIDSWWFNPRHQTQGRFAGDILKDDTRDIPAHFTAYRRVFHLARRGRLQWPLVKKILSGDDKGVKRFGLLAWQGSGMRNDGSNQTFDRSTSDKYESKLPTSLQELLDMKHPSMLEGSEADDALVSRMREVLRKVAARGTLVVGFSPPFASEVMKAYAAHPEHYGFHSDYLRDITRMFAEEGWPYYDGSDLTRFGLDDRAMKDKDHAQETYHIALLAEMAKNEKVREALRLDPVYLQGLLSDPRTTPWFPIYPERARPAPVAK